MSWITIDIPKANEYAGALKEQCEEFSRIAKEFFSDCWDMQYFGFHPRKDIFFYVTNLRRWCGNGKQYKIDFYRFEKEYFLCVKRINNEAFEEENLPPKIRQCICCLFTRREQMIDKKCIQLIKCSDKTKVIEALRKLVDLLKGPFE